MKKKHNVWVLILLTIFTCFFTGFAPAKNENYWEDLAEKTGISAEELKKGYASMDQEEFEASVQKLMSAMRFYELHPKSSTNRSDSLIDINDWTLIKSSLSDGSILITTDSSHYDFRHGHVAIISGAYSMELSPLSRVYYYTERPGPNKLSVRRVLNNEEELWWRKRANVAVFNAIPTSVMGGASAVARTSRVLGKPYNILANKLDTDAYTCSSLVYRCYLDQGLDIGDREASMVLPVDIALSFNVNMVHEYGDFEWR